MSCASCHVLNTVYDFYVCMNTNLSVCQTQSQGSHSQCSLPEHLSTSPLRLASPPPPRHMLTAKAHSSTKEM